MNTCVKRCKMTPTKCCCPLWRSVESQPLRAGQRGGLAALNAAMLEFACAEAVWDSLSDAQRQALQMLIGSGGMMPLAKFGRLFGEARQMDAQIERGELAAKPAQCDRSPLLSGVDRAHL